MSTSAAEAARRSAVAAPSSESTTIVVGPGGTELGETVGVAAGADDPAGTEMLGHLDRHGTRVAGGTQHEDRLAGLEGNATAQGDPGRHGRVHGCGHLDHVDVCRQGHRPAQVDECSLGHGAADIVGADEVHVAPVVQPAHPVDPGDHGQDSGARVMAARGVASDPRVQADGQHVDEDFVGPRGLVEVMELVAGRVVEGSDHGGVHAHVGTWPPAWLGSSRSW